MDIIEQINVIEREVITKYKSMPVWDKIAHLDKKSLSKLLISNYCYSVNFQRIITDAFENANTTHAKGAIEHIVAEEIEPEEHVLIHQKTLKSCGLKLPENCDTIDTGSALTTLVETSFRYARPTNESEDLAMLCFFRIGAEILAGELYRALRRVVPKTFGVSENEIEFITLHAEHDCKTTDIGIMPKGKEDSRGYYPHADRFNTPITRLVESIGRGSSDIAKSAYNDAYQTRAAYIREISSY